MTGIKQKLFKGAIWSAVERYSVQGVQFILNIILARLLTPEAFGLVGLLAIFISISQAFVLSGFGAALVQKSDRDEKDFSTTLYYNVSIAILFYILLFLSAPFIAKFYDKPILIDLTRVIGLVIVIEAFSVVQRAKFTINVDFKSLSKASLTSVIVSGGVGIYLAYIGAGVWSLVFYRLTKVFVEAVLLWIIGKWWPKEIFSYTRFKGLFSFGSKLLLAGIMNAIAQNISKIIIGKAFSTQTLGFYTRAQQFAQFPSINVQGALGRVTFPVLCKFQDDKKRLVQNYNKIVKVTAFIIFPLMIGLNLLAEPLIITLLTDRWEESIWMLKIISIGLIFTSINRTNVSILNAIGRSDIFFKADMVKHFSITVLLVVLVPFGIKIMLWGQVIAMFFTFVISLFIIKKVVEINIAQYFYSFLPIIINCLLMVLTILIINNLLQSNLNKLIFGTLIGAFVYLSTGWLFNIAEIKTFLLDSLRKK